MAPCLVVEGATFFNIRSIERVTWTRAFSFGGRSGISLVGYRTSTRAVGAMLALCVKDDGVTFDATKILGRRPL